MILNVQLNNKFLQIWQDLKDKVQQYHTATVSD